MTNISFSESCSSKQKYFGILINEQFKLDNNTIELDKECNGVISKALKEDNGFEGKLGQSFALTVVWEEQISYIILIGIGNESNLFLYDLERVGGELFHAANKIRADIVYIRLEHTISSFSVDQVCQSLSLGVMLASYKFSKYKFALDDAAGGDDMKNSDTYVKDIVIVTDHLESAQELYRNAEALWRGIFLSRDCINEPANYLTPAVYSSIISQELDALGIDVQIIGEIEMRRLGMGGILAVGHGSMNESKAVIMRYIGDKDTSTQLGLVGKGVTFDTGGISLKPAHKMDQMKYDMAGSAAVVGFFKTLALRKSKINVVGMVGLVENMPGGSAQKPGDVITTMSGKTVEVLNTDAEGRLVLCDCMWYLQEKFSINTLIDFATLTGAIVVALGHSYAGCFCNDDVLASQLIASSQKSNEKIWRMPLDKAFNSMIDSHIADMANIGTKGGAAGSSTAAEFLQRFVKENVKWAHLDIAGVAWSEADQILNKKGGVGFGVKLLNQFVADYYEQ